MTEVVIVEGEGDGAPVSADVIADGLVQAAHELEQEAQIERAEATAEEALEAAQAAESAAFDANYHAHPEYEHDHSDIESRLAAVEEWRATVVAAQTPQEEVISVEPQADTTAAAEPAAPAESERPKEHHGFRRGR